MPTVCVCVCVCRGSLQAGKRNYTDRLKNEPRLSLEGWLARPRASASLSVDMKASKELRRLPITGMPDCCFFCRDRNMRNDPRRFPDDDVDSGSES